MVGSALATLLSVAGHTEAGMIASSFLTEDGGGRQIHCNISNVGTKESIVLSARIVDGAGNDMPLGSTCYGTIPAGRGCALIAYGDVAIFVGTRTPLTSAPRWVDGTRPRTAACPTDQHLGMGDESVS